MDGMEWIAGIDGTEGSRAADAEAARRNRRDARFEALGSGDTLVPSDGLGSLGVPGSAIGPGSPFDSGVTCPFRARSAFRDRTAG